MKNISLLTMLAFLISISCKQADRTNPYEGMDYKEVCKEFDELAYEQKDLLDQIRSKFKSDKLFISRFNDEQISWIQYQDKRLRSLYRKDWDRFYRKNYGVPVFNGCKCKELIRLSKIRNQDLKVYLIGPDESQEECPVQGAL